MLFNFSKMYSKHCVFELFSILIITVVSCYKGHKRIEQFIGSVIPVLGDLHISAVSRQKV